MLCCTNYLMFYNVNKIHIYTMEIRILSNQIAASLPDIHWLSFLNFLFFLVEIWFDVKVFWLYVT